MKFYNYIEDNKNKIIDIYFDMDGVFVEYDIGNFDYETIRPINYVINIMKKIKNDGCNLKILSICKNNKIVEEKKMYINKHLPFFDIEDAVLLSKEELDGESNEIKSNYLKNNINKEHINILIDDDSSIIKKVVKDNSDVKVFHVSSIIE